MNTPPVLRQVGRVHAEAGGRRLLYFGGCDYYRLARHPQVWAAARRTLAIEGLNVAASRVTTGNHPLYQRLEAALAAWSGQLDAAVVPCGYAANTVALQALGSSISHVFLDERAHPSLCDAACQSAAPRQTFHHRDARHLATQLQRLAPQACPAVLTDGLCARDGSLAPLVSYAKLLSRRGWLVVDDAHGLGVLGEHGRGTPEQCGLRFPRLVHTGTLSKAFGAYGGVILAPPALLHRLRTASRQYAGSTPCPLPLVAAALAAIDLLTRDPGFRSRLQTNTRHAKARLRAAGLSLPDTPSPILSVSVKNSSAAASLRNRLLKHGIFPSLVRYPGGPKTGYFRFVLSSEHTLRQIDRLLEVLLQTPGLAPVG